MVGTDPGGEPPSFPAELVEPGASRDDPRSQRVQAPPSRVLVLDDDALMLATARRILERAGHQVETFDSPREFLRDARLEPPCCVLLELQMPEASGLDVQAALARGGAPLAVIFMSARADVPSSVQAMKAGAVDFLTKPFSAEALVAAVAVALRRSVAACAARDAAAQARGRLALLSPREREVAALLAQGLKNREVGERLGAAEKTIKIHRGRVMEKLGIQSAAELVPILAQAAGAAGDGP